VAAIEHSGGLSLLRDFIHESLYHPGFGYFASRDVPVGRMPKPLDFRSLLGQGGYNYALAKAYSQLQVTTNKGVLLLCAHVQSINTSFDKRIPPHPPNSAPEPDIACQWWREVRDLGILVF
jgi:hypothetical protein